MKAEFGVHRLHKEYDSDGLNKMRKRVIQCILVNQESASEFAKICESEGFA